LHCPGITATHCHGDMGNMESMGESPQRKPSREGSPAGGTGRQPPACKWTKSPLTSMSQLTSILGPHHLWYKIYLTQLQMSVAPHLSYRPHDFLQSKTHLGHSPSDHSIILKIGQRTCPKSAYFSSLPVLEQQTRRPLPAGKSVQIR